MDYHATGQVKEPIPHTAPVSSTPHSRDRSIWRHRSVQIAISFALILISLFCYALLILIFISPSTLRIKSLVSPDAAGLKPTVAVTLLSGLLAVTTGALATRAVEHYFWLRLSPLETNPKRFLETEEVRNLAEWTVSPVSRLAYVLSGNSWLLKIAGVLIIAITALNPVLLAGISERSQLSVGSRSIPRIESWDPYFGFIHESNYNYNSGQFQDFPTQVAAALALSNMSAPAEPTICKGDRRCVIEASVAALQATCTPSRTDNPDFDADPYARRFRNTTVSSRYNPALKATIFGGNPNQYAHFTSDIGRSKPAEDGIFAYILGVYIPQPRDLETDGSWAQYIRQVDCKVEYGTKTISQRGSESPELRRASFKNGPTPDSMFFPSRIYNEGYSSPFSFKARIGGAAGETNLFTQSVTGSLLLGGRANVDETHVATKIEEVFDMATIMAWIRRPEAALSTAVSQENETRQYTFERISLLILIVPVLILVLTGLETGMKVGSAEDVVGYNPLMIADRGPVARMGSESVLGEKSTVVARGVHKSDYGWGDGPGIVVVASARN